MQVPALDATGLLAVATLVARLAKQLAVLLLRHTLATLLDNRTHVDLTKNQGHAAGTRRHEVTVYPTSRRVRDVALSDGGRLQQMLDGGLRHAERSTEADGGEFAGVDESVDGHAGDAHHVGHLGDRQEAHVLEIVCHTSVPFLPVIVLGKVSPCATSSG